MGKETKIGLVVIGILLVIFGGLLVRRFAAANGGGAQISVARTVAEPLSTLGMTEKPAVVLAQSAAPESAGIWSASGRDTQSDGETDAAAPRRNFLPGGDAPSDRDDTMTQPAAAQEPELPSASNPFSVPGRGLSPAPDAPPDREATHEALEVPTSDSQANEAPAHEPEEAAQVELPSNTEQTVDEPANTARFSSVDQDAALEPAATAAAASEPQLTIARGQEPAEQAQQPAAPEAADDMRWVTPPARQATGTPPPVVNGKYTVQPNDNLWVVSEKVYGTGGYFKALREHNRRVLQHADLLVVGSILDVPPLGVLEKNYPSLCPKQRKSAVVKARALTAGGRGRRAGGADMYVVTEGDTLFDIARYELGKASRWAEIYELNREILGDDYDHLVPGTELAMPARSQPTDSVTQQPDSRYQR